MKLNELKKWLAIGAAVMMGLSLTACANQQETVQEAPVATEVVEEPAEEEVEEEVEEEYVEEEYEEDVEAESVSKAASTQGSISFDDVMDSYNQLVDLYNQVYGLYQDETVPQDDGVEEILNDISASLDEIAGLSEEDIPTDEDKMAVLTTIGELGGTLNDLIEPLVEASNETVSEQDYYNRLFDLVQQNYDYMNAYFNSVWDHLATYGGTEDQIEGVVMARDAIGDISNLSSSTSEDLETINDNINYVIDLLDAICGR